MLTTKQVWVFITKLVEEATLVVGCTGASFHCKMIQQEHFCFQIKALPGEIFVTFIGRGFNCYCAATYLLLRLLLSSRRLLLFLFFRGVEIVQDEGLGCTEFFVVVVNKSWLWLC